MLGENVSYIQLNFRAKSQQSLVNIIDKIRTFFLRCPLCLMKWNVCIDT